MANSLTITSDTVVKTIVRNGLDVDRKNIILSNGELGYAIDTNRLFIGDGFTVGGYPVGSVCYGVISNKNTYTSLAQTGDLIYDTTDYTLYSYSGATSGWTNIHPHFDNISIISTNGVWGVNPLLLSGSGGSISDISALSAVHALSAKWIYGYNDLSFMPGYSVKVNTSSSTGSASNLIINGIKPQFLGNTGSAGLTAVTLSAGNGIRFATTNNTLALSADVTLATLSSAIAPKADITYVDTRNYMFRATESYPVTATDTELQVVTQYVNQTGNPTASGTSLGSGFTNIWRKLNTIEYNYNSFASIQTVGGSSNATYVQLSPGTYHIQAGASLQQTETHCVSLLKFTPGMTDYTSIANGSVSYSEKASQYASAISMVAGRFTFTQTTGIVLWNAFNGSNNGKIPFLGSMSFAHNGAPPDWLKAYLPKIVTAWIDIQKIV